MRKRTSLIVSGVLAATLGTAVTAPAQGASGGTNTSRRAAYQARQATHPTLQKVSSTATPLDGQCSITGYHPTSVTVGTTHVISATFGVSVSGCSLAGWSLEGSNPNTGFFVYDGAPTETWDPAGMFNTEAGYQDVTATADNSDYSFETTRVFTNGFTLRRNTTFVNFNASEPVKKGSSVHIVGTLKIADWDTNVYVPFAGHHVDVQFRTPTGTYKSVKTVVTSSTGSIDTTVTDNATGVWRLYYGGLPYAGSAVVVGDSVSVY